MTTELTVWASQDIPTATPQLAQSMSPQKLAEHRKKISFDVEVILQGYWQALPPEEIKAAMLADWADSLEDWSHKQILWALRKWRNENPNKKPNPGHILSILKLERGKAEAKRMKAKAPEPEAPRERISPERAKEIAEEAGCRVGSNGKIIVASP